MNKPNPVEIIEGLLRRVTEYAETHGVPVQSEVWTDIEVAIECLRLIAPCPRPRCLVFVRNGVADYVHDDGIEVRLFDRDNYECEPPAGRQDLEMPAHFQDLAEPLGIPIQAT